MHSSSAHSLSGRPCGFPPAGKPVFKDVAFEVDAVSMAAAGPGGVWRYHSSPPFELKGGQVNMQDQVVALATPSGALGLSSFSAVVQEFDEVLGNWVEVKPTAETYLHHFTVDNTFSADDYNELSIQQGGEGYALTCRNNAAFEAGNGGSGARVYDFGDHYISDKGRRLPSWPAGNSSLWHFGSARSSQALHDSP